MAAKIVCFIEGESVPASRFRILQFVDELRYRGYDVKVCSTKPTKYLWYPKWCKKFLPIRIVWACFVLAWICLQRLYQIFRYGTGADIVVIQRDLLYRVPVPFLEALLFGIARAKARVVFDVDDAIYLNKDGAYSGVLERKLRFICRNCDLVIVGNGHLEGYFNKISTSLVIPTCIDTLRYLPKSAAAEEASRLPVVGWTGVRTNLSSLTAIIPALDALKREIGFRLVIITDKDAEIPASLRALGAEHIPWNPLREVEDLHSIDIGVMPLIDDEWSKGKCGFKLLQYMATGIPCVASAVGVNPEIVSDGVNGYLARNFHEWSSALRQLILNEQLRRDMGAKGRQTVEERYSVVAWSKTFTAAILGGHSRE